MTRILLIDALSYADGDASYAASMVQSRNDNAHETGISLEHQPAADRTHAGESLADIQARTKAALLKGEIDGALLPLTAFQRQSALFGADQIPFLVVDAAANARLIEVLAPLIDDRLAEHGLALLGLLPMRPRGLMGMPRRLSGLPRKIAVGDAAGRRLAELIGSEAVETPQTQIAETPLEAGYTSILDRNSPSAAPPDRSKEPHQYQLLAVAGWPLAMIVVRRELVAAKFDLVRNEFWPAAARQAEVTHKRWQASMVHAYWPAAATRLVTSPDATPAITDDQATDVAQKKRLQVDRGQVHAQGDRGQSDVTKSDRRPREPAARLRAAGLTMAQEWAIGAGADGLALLEAMGVPPGEDR